LWISANIKKKKNTLFVYSLLLAKLNDKFHQVIFELDATSSSLQFESILTRDVTLAQASNDTHYDIYQEYSSKFATELDTCFDSYLQSVLRILFNMSHSEFCDHYSKLLLKNESPQGLTNLIARFLLQEEQLDNDPGKSSVSWDHIFKLLPGNNNKEFNNMILELQKISFIPSYMLPKIQIDATPGFYNNNIFLFVVVNFGKIKTLFLFARHLLKLYNIRNNLPFDLKDRGLFKRAVMTLGYNAGGTARLAFFKETLIDKYISLRFSNYPRAQITYLSSTLNKFVIATAQKQLKSIFVFADICFLA
jgi:hypothetical protein